MKTTRIITLASIIFSILPISSAEDIIEPRHSPPMTEIEGDIYVTGAKEFLTNQNIKEAEKSLKLAIIKYNKTGNDPCLQKKVKDCKKLLETIKKQDS